MSDISKDRPSALHIGWWRQGYHEYDRAEESMTNPVTPEHAGSREGEIRKRAMVAAAISMAWLIGGCAGWFALRVLGSDFEVVPGLIAVGGAVALLPSALLGRRYAPSAVETGRAFLPMAIWVVLLTDLEVVLAAFLSAAAVIFVGFNGYAALDPITLGTNLFWDALRGVAGAVAIYLLGLLIFGLPGLAMGLPSAWFWQHRMRRKFTTSTE